MEALEAVMLVAATPEMVGGVVSGEVVEPPLRPVMR